MNKYNNILLCNSNLLYILVIYIIYYLYLLYYY